MATMNHLAAYQAAKIRRASCDKEWREKIDEVRRAGGQPHGDGSPTQPYYEEMRRADDEMKRRWRDLCQSVVDGIAYGLEYIEQQKWVDANKGRSRDGEPIPFWRLKSANGSEVSVQFDEHKKRVLLSYSFPNEWLTYGYTPHSITCALDREPTAIAKEVARRLLPGAREEHHRLATLDGAAKRSTAAREGAAARLATETGFALDNPAYNERERLTVTRPSVRDGAATSRRGYSATVRGDIAELFADVTLRGLTVDEAIEVGKWLAAKK